MPLCDEVQSKSCQGMENLNVLIPHTLRNVSQHIPYVVSFFLNNKNKSTNYYLVHPTDC